MTTNLHSRLEQMEGRTFYSAKNRHQCLTARQAIAERAGVALRDIVDLEYDGITAVGAKTASKILDALGDVQGSHIDDKEKMRLVAGDTKTVIKQNEGAMTRDKKRYL
jgi:hypothetical protein